LDWSVLQIKAKIFSCHTADSKPVKQEVNGTVILPPLVFLAPLLWYAPGLKAKRLTENSTRTIVLAYLPEASVTAKIS